MSLLTDTTKNLIQEIISENSYVEERDGAPYMSINYNKIFTEIEKTFNQKVSYNLSGLVYGNYWGGGEGSYAMHTFTDIEDVEKWKEEYKNKLESLDSGMGYESVLGALVNVEVVTSVEFDRQTFRNYKTYSFFLGELTEEQQEFLENLNYA